MREFGYKELLLIKSNLPVDFIILHYLKETDGNHCFYLRSVKGNNSIFVDRNRLSLVTSEGFCQYYK